MVKENCCYIAFTFWAFSLDIKELNPPIVSFSEPYIDPLLSNKNTMSIFSEFALVSTIPSPLICCVQNVLKM